MQRRNFLIGAGSTAVGAAALVGSGAYTAMTASRNASVDVVNDASGLMALGVGNVPSDVVREENGELTIDFTAAGNAGGVNIDSRYQVGTFDTDYATVPPGALETQSGIGSDYAFSVMNQDTITHDVRVKFEADDTGSYNGSALHFQYVPTGDFDSKLRTLDESVGNNVEAFTMTLPSGEGYKASILVDTRDATGNPADIDLSGILTISAAGAGDYS